MRRFLFACLVAASALFPILADAQTYPVQSGKVLSGHAPVWQSNGAGVNSAFVGDAGTAAAPSSNPITDLPIVATGTPVCIYDALPSNPAGAHKLCLGANSNGSALISLSSVGGASALGLNFSINGTTYAFPGNGNGNVLGPVSSVLGDVATFNSTGGGVISDGGAPPGLAVATNALLKAMTGAAGMTVYRQGFFTAGDGGSASYTWNTSNCPLNSGAGDNGSQVAPNAGTGCWLIDAVNKLIVPQVFGAKGDCATNDRPAVQSWLAFGYSGTPSPLLWVPKPSSTGCFSLNDGTSLLISGPINIQGAGIPVDSAIQTLTCTPGAPMFKWNSAVAAPVMTIISPTISNTLSGGSVTGFCVDGNYKATYGVKASSLLDWYFDISEQRVANFGLQIDDCNGNGTPGAGLSANVVVNRNYYNSGGTGFGSDNSGGVRLDASCTNTGVTNSHLGQLQAVVLNGDGFVNLGGDADQVDWAFTFTLPGGTGNGVAFRCFNSNAVCGRTTQIHMAQGPVLAEAGSYGNVIDFLHSEGTKVVLQGTPGGSPPQAQLQYHVVDNGNGSWFKAHEDYLLYDELTIPAALWTGAQFPGAGASGPVTSSAAGATNVLTFSGGIPAGIVNGMGVADLTQAINGSLLGVAAGTTVASTTGTTVTLSANLVSNGVASNDTILFGNQAALTGNDTVQTFGKTVLFPQNINSAAVSSVVGPVRWLAGQIVTLKVFGYYDQNCAGTDSFKVDALSSDFTSGGTLGGDSTGFPQTFSPTTSGPKNTGQIINLNLSPSLPVNSRYGIFFRITRQPGGTCQGIDFFMTGLVAVYGGGGPSINALGPFGYAQPPWHH